MSLFDDAMFDGDQAAFQNLEEGIILNGIAVNGIVHTQDVFENTVGSDGGISKNEYVIIEVFTSDFQRCVGIANPVGIKAITDPGTIRQRTFAIRSVGNNTHTVVLSCASTSGTTRAQF